MNVCTCYLSKVVPEGSGSLVSVSTTPGSPAVRRGVLAVLLLVAGGLEASTVLHLPLDQMAIRADQIFTGEVLGVTSQMNARGTGIYTFVTIAVNEYLKGGRRSVLTLRILGGEAEGYRLVVPGSPTFRLGEEVLVFTDGGAGRIPTVLGMAAGKFALERDPVTGEQILERSLAGLTLRDSRGDPVAPPSNSSDDHALLADVRQIVREALVAQ